MRSRPAHPDASRSGTVAVVSGDKRIDEEYLRMTIQLEANQYGKAENRVVRIYRDTARHEIRDLNVSRRCAATSRTPT